MAFEKNDILTLTIEDLGIDGEGIGKVDGYPIFVKDAVIGDVVEAKILKAKKNFAYARLEKVLTPSEHRIEPPCPYARQCGGCQIQPLNYEEQLRFKHKKVRNNLLHIGGFKEEFIDSIMEPIVGMEQPLRYRNKAQFPFGKDKEGNTVTGFYAGRTHSIIANIDCLLGVEENKQILECVLDYMRENHIQPYDEKSGRGLIRHVLIRKGFTSGELMVCMVINGKRLPKADLLIAKLSRISGMKSISISINTENTNVIMGKEIQNLWGEERISDTIHVRECEQFTRTGKGLEFAISPLSFYQVNPEQTEKLYSLALEYAGLTGRETVWDLYCGIGTISLFLAQKAKMVYGVEIVPEAIADAKENARKNQLTNTSFIVGKAEEVLPEFYHKTDETDGAHCPDVIVVDPPRKGCDEKCLETMVQMQPDRIVYVSCDSATLARDLQYLCKQGYVLQKIRAVDQFAQTVHVETVALLKK